MKTKYFVLGLLGIWGMGQAQLTPITPAIDPPVTRSQAIYSIITAAEIQTQTVTMPPFVDVAITDPIAPYAQVAKINNWVSNPAYFNGDEYIDIASFSKLLVDILEIENQNEENLTFTTWYQKYIFTLYNARILNSAAMDPQSIVTTTEMNTIIQKAKQHHLKQKPQKILDQAHDIFFEGIRFVENSQVGAAKDAFSRSWTKAKESHTLSPTNQNEALLWMNMAMIYFLTTPRDTDAMLYAATRASELDPRFEQISSTIKAQSP